jgi:hypothetical protein
VITLSPEVRAALDTHLDTKSRFLLARNAKAQRTGSAVFSGVSALDKRRRRAAGKVAKASRKANRGR